MKTNNEMIVMKSNVIETVKDSTNVPVKSSDAGFRQMQIPRESCGYGSVVAISHENTK